MVTSRGSPGRPSRTAPAYRRLTLPAPGGQNPQQTTRPERSGGRAHKMDQDIASIFLRWRDLRPTGKECGKHFLQTLAVPHLTFPQGQYMEALGF